MQINFLTYKLFSSFLPRKALLKQVYSLFYIIKIIHSTSEETQLTFPPQAVVHPPLQKIKTAEKNHRDSRDPKIIRFPPSHFPIDYDPLFD